MPNNGTSTVLFYRTDRRPNSGDIGTFHIFEMNVTCSRVYNDLSILFFLSNRAPRDSREFAYSVRGNVLESCPHLPSLCSCSHLFSRQLEIIEILRFFAEYKSVELPNTSGIYFLSFRFHENLTFSGPDAVRHHRTHADMHFRLEKNK